MQQEKLGLMKESVQQDVTNNRKIGLDNQPNILLLILVIVFGAMTGRLFWLQVVQGSFYRKLSDENRIRLVSKSPIRHILSRKISRWDYTKGTQP